MTCHTYHLHPGPVPVHATAGEGDMVIVPQWITLDEARAKLPPPVVPLTPQELERAITASRPNAAWPALSSGAGVYLGL